jgi:hypothetical protein
MTLSIYKTFTREKLTYQDLNNSLLTIINYINNSVELTANLVSANTANKGVRRDASGNFAAGTITANLTGTASKSTNLVGGLVGQIPYQSAADTTALLAAGTDGQILKAKGAAAPEWSNLQSLSVTGDWDIGNYNLRAKTLQSDVATGTAPLIIASTTEVANLRSAKTSGIVETGSDGLTLHKKIINIGDWNMVSTVAVSIAHGLDYTKIKSVSATIRNDNQISHYSLFESGTVRWADTTITLGRATGGQFDSSQFDSIGFNRGWVIIDYSD